MSLPSFLSYLSGRSDIKPQSASLSSACSDSAIRHLDFGENLGQCVTVFRKDLVWRLYLELQISKHMSWVILQVTETSLINLGKRNLLKNKLTAHKTEGKLKNQVLGKDRSQVKQDLLQQYLITLSSGTPSRWTLISLSFCVILTPIFKCGGKEHLVGPAWGQFLAQGKGKGAKTAAMGWNKIPQRTETFLEKGTDAVQTKTHIYYNHQVEAFHKPINGRGTCPLEMR